MEITTKTIEQYQGYTLTLYTSEGGRKMWELKDGNNDRDFTLTLKHNYDFENNTTNATVEVLVSSGGAMNFNDAADYAEKIMNAAKDARYLTGVIELTEAKN